MESSVLDRDLKVFQEDKQQELSALNAEANELKRTMNQNQKTMYYGRVLSQSELDTGILSDEMPKADISMKKLVMGGILGGLLMVVIYSLRFLSQNKLHSGEDFETALGIANIGFAERPSKKKLNFIDKKIRRSELRILDGLNEEEQFNVILANIKHSCHGADKVYISCPVGDELAVRLSESLSSAGISCHVVSNIMKETGAVDEGSGVVFIVRTEYSTYTQLYREIKFCKIYDAKLIGAAVEI